MKRVLLFAGCLALLLSGTVAAESIILYVGQQKTQEVKNASQISIAGKGKIATGTVLDDGRQIVITGVAPGTVSMTVHYRDGREEEKTIRVLSRDQEQVILEFDKISSLFNDVKILPLGVNVGLIGRIYSIQEKDYLIAFLGRYPEIINLTEDVRGEVLIQLDVQIVEVNLTGAANLGIKWFDETKAAVSFGGGVDYGEIKTEQGAILAGEKTGPRELWPNAQSMLGPIARLSPITARLNFLVEKGQAKMLARPKLICRSGEKASFRVGGEIPIRVATPEKVSVEWRSYGTQLEAEPVLVKMGANEVEVKIKVEISDLDWANAVADFPAISQRIVSTQVKIAENSTVALAGLLSRKKSRVQSRIPYLGAIPYLGRLFSSTKDSEEEMETVILISPRIIPIRSTELNIKPELREMQKEVR